MVIAPTFNRSPSGGDRAVLTACISSMFMRRSQLGRNGGWGRGGAGSDHHMSITEYVYVYLLDGSEPRAVILVKQSLNMAQHICMSIVRESGVKRTTHPNSLAGAAIEF